MTRASEDLLKALAGLRKAAGALEGGARQAAAQTIDELARLAGAEGETLEGGAEDLSFGEALGEARKLAERELSGNAFYSAMHKLDTLASLANAAPHPAASAPDAVLEPAPQEHLEPQSEAAPESAPEDLPAKAPDGGIEGGVQAVSFDELSAAAKARVEEVAVSLGVEVAYHHHETPPLYRRVEEAPVEAAELEKRSSEPCAMPEILPADGEPVASPTIEAVSAREIVEAAHDIGTPALAAEPLPEAPAHIEAALAPEPVAEEAVSEPAIATAAVIEPHPAPEPVRDAPAPEPEPELVAEAPAPEPAPAPRPEPAVALAPQPEPTPAPAKDAPPAAPRRDAAPSIKGAKPKEQQTPKERQKTLFGLWLDMVFGRGKK